MGHAVCIVKPKNEHQYELDFESLKKILLQDGVQNADVMLVSIAGAFRQGKSFLLNFFLRYLNSDDQSDWMEDESDNLEGFSWRGGMDRETTGILMWSRAFPRELPSGEKVVVLLMDTQGVFDSESTVKDNAIVFALSTMMSSFFIYNIQNNIQEDHLQHLQVFTEYGRLALKEDSHKPFQKLLFLVRDWSYPYDADYGSAGGKFLLKRRMKISDSQHPELQLLRKHISSCFQDISCFLLPHPGHKVSTDPSFSGRLSDIDSEFKEHLGVLVPLVLSVKNTTVKEIGGQKVKAKDLLHYFQSYMKVLSGHELPEPITLFFATVQASNLVALSGAIDFYKKQMNRVCGGTRPYIIPEQLAEQHSRLKTAAVHQFISVPQMGGAEFSKKYHAMLESDIDEMFREYMLVNKRKNIGAVVKIPAVYVTIAVVSYIISGILETVHLPALAIVMQGFTHCALGIIVLWAIIWRFGIFGGLEEIIETVADIVWVAALMQT
ncbi:atlastin-like [Anabrus simplex]|uniref:atlastin-like n=1 Tax=Anabrus simplex TaxID=316456 RepID=UPI0035A2A69C